MCIHTHTCIFVECRFTKALSSWRLSQQTCVLGIVPTKQTFQTAPCNLLWSCMEKNAVFFVGFCGYNPTQQALCFCLHSVGLPCPINQVLRHHGERDEDIGTAPCDKIAILSSNHITLLILCHRCSWAVITDTARGPTLAKAVGFNCLPVTMWKIYTLDVGSRTGDVMPNQWVLYVFIKVRLSHTVATMLCGWGGFLLTGALHIVMFNQESLSGLFYVRVTLGAFLCF